MRSAYAYAGELVDFYQRHIIVAVPSSRRVARPAESLILTTWKQRSGKDQMAERLATVLPQSPTTTFRLLHPRKARYD
jgi:hypothetical protein